MLFSASMIAGLLGFVVICVLAWVKGGPSERAAAAVLIASTLVNIAIHSLAPKGAQNFMLLALDALIAVSFLLLALRYTSVWLGGAMLLQAAQFSLHAYYLVTERVHDRGYAVVNNVISYALLACVLTGTLLAWRKRVQAAK